MAKKSEVLRAHSVYRVGNKARKIASSGDKKESKNTQVIQNKAGKKRKKKKQRPHGQIENNSSVV